MNGYRPGIAVAPSGAGSLPPGLDLAPGLQAQKQHLELRRIVDIDQFAHADG